MAIAKIEITCTACGCTFTHRKECRNRTEANSYEQWAVNNIATCPDCHRKAMRESAASKLQDTLSSLGITLPAIEGVSEKQVAYAHSTRERYLADRIKSVETYHDGMTKLMIPENLESTRQACAEAGLTLDEGIEQDLRAIGLYKVHIALTSTSARVILDNLAR